MLPDPHRPPTAHTRHVQIDASGQAASFGGRYIASLHPFPAHAATLAAIGSAGLQQPEINAAGSAAKAR
jgi:hypothetical protein